MFIAPPLQSCRVFPCALTDAFYRNKFKNRFSRAIFFGRAEEFFTALRKYRSNRPELLLNREQPIMVVKIARGDQHEIRKRLF